MQISVWDTYVKRQDGNVMHFDILVPSDFKDEGAIFSYGRDYLSTKTFETGELSSRECKFCHIEQATQKVVADITDRGYSIVEMENCK